MTKFVGPTFQSELATAGVPPGVWQDGTGALNFGPALTPDQQATAQQVYAAHDPTRLMPRTATAKQVRYAVTDLGVRSAWNTAVTASDQPSQDYWTSADPMFESNPKIAKWCKAVGITPKALFDQAAVE